MIKRKRYLPLAAIAALALATAGCLHDDDEGPATDGMDMIPDDDEMMPDEMMPRSVASGPVAFMAGVDRLPPSSRTVGLTDDGMTIVVEDTTQTPSGWSLTVGGRTVELDADDLGSLSSFPTIYVGSTGDRNETWFWRESGDFGDDPDFDYLNVYAFAHSTSVPDADLSSLEPSDFEQMNVVYIAHGTTSSTMPVSGTATYDGRVEAREWPSNAAVFSGGATFYDGDFDMTASFNATGANVTGSFSFDDVPGGTIPFTVDVTDNQLSVSGLSITEGPFAGYQNIGVRGAFFGPAAVEVGGVFEGENPTASTLMHGYFAGEQTQDDQ